MTPRRTLDERDPQPQPEWRQTSSPGIRRLARQACADAIDAAKRRHQEEDAARRHPRAEETS